LPARSLVVQILLVPSISMVMSVLLGPSIPVTPKPPNSGQAPSRCRDPQAPPHLTDQLRSCLHLINRLSCGQPPLVSWCAPWMLNHSTNAAGRFYKIAATYLGSPSGIASGSPLSPSRHLSCRYPSIADRLP
jgi:hypothetical protein